MLHLDDLLVKRFLDLRTEEKVREAETQRLIRQARLVREGWFSRQVRWLVCQIGHRLVTLGNGLTRRARLHSFPPTEHASAGAPCGTSACPIQP